MEILQRFIIRQKVSLANNTKKWIDIDTFDNEGDAWDAFDIASKQNHVIALVKYSELQLA